MKMRKIGILVFIVLCTLVYPLRAQLIPYAGVSAGYSSSQLDFDPGVESVQTSPLPGFTAGIHLEWFDNPIAGMMTDVNYLVAGAEINSVRRGLEILSLSQQLALYVPMLSKVWEVYITAGPQVNYLLDHPNGLNEGEPGFEEWVFGYRLGTGVEYNFKDFKLYLNGQYAADISPQYQSEWAPSNREVILTSQVFLLTTGIALEL